MPALSRKFSAVGQIDVAWSNCERRGWPPVTLHCTLRVAFSLGLRHGRLRAILSLARLPRPSCTFDAYSAPHTHSRLTYPIVVYMQVSPSFLTLLASSAPKRLFK
eukprot:365808-Chlamydomonas_euryale.AAC.21